MIKNCPVSDERKCHRCDKVGHIKAKCTAAAAEVHAAKKDRVKVKYCKYCRKRGHDSSGCRSKPKAAAPAQAPVGAVPATKGNNGKHKQRQRSRKSKQKEAQKGQDPTKGPGQGTKQFEPIRKSKEGRCNYCGDVGHTEKRCRIRTLAGEKRDSHIKSTHGIEARKMKACIAAGKKGRMMAVGDYCPKFLQLGQKEKVRPPCLGITTFEDMAARTRSFLNDPDIHNVYLRSVVREYKAKVPNWEELMRTGFKTVGGVYMIVNWKQKGRYVGMSGKQTLCQRISQHFRPEGYLDKCAMVRYFSLFNDVKSYIILPLLLCTDQDELLRAEARALHDWRCTINIKHSVIPRRSARGRHPPSRLRTGTAQTEEDDAETDGGPSKFMKSKADMQRLIDEDVPKALEKVKMAGARLLLRLQRDRVIRPDDDPMSAMARIYQACANRLEKIAKPPQRIMFTFSSKVFDASLIEAAFRSEAARNEWPYSKDSLTKLRIGWRSQPTLRQLVCNFTEAAGLPERIPDIAQDCECHTCASRVKWRGHSVGEAGEILGLLADRETEVGRAQKLKDLAAVFSGGAKFRMEASKTTQKTTFRQEFNTFLERKCRNNPLESKIRRWADIVVEEVEGVIDRTEIPPSLYRELFDKELVESLQAHWVFVPMDKTPQTISMVCSKFYRHVVHERIYGPGFIEASEEQLNETIRAFERDPNSAIVSYLYTQPKFHKADKEAWREVVGSKGGDGNFAAEETRLLADALGAVIDANRRLADDLFQLDGVQRCMLITQTNEAGYFYKSKKGEFTNFMRFVKTDFSDMYPSCGAEKVKRQDTKGIRRAFKAEREKYILRNPEAPDDLVLRVRPIRASGKYVGAEWQTEQGFTEEELIALVCKVVDASFVRNGEIVRKQRGGIAIGSESAPPEANIALMEDEWEHIEELLADESTSIKVKEIHGYLYVMRYVDDCWCPESHAWILPSEAKYGLKYSSKESATTGVFVGYEYRSEKDCFRTRMGEKQRVIAFPLKRYPHTESCLMQNCSTGSIVGALFYSKQMADTQETFVENAGELFSIIAGRGTMPAIFVKGIEKHCRMINELSFLQKAAVRAELLRVAEKSFDAARQGEDPCGKWADHAKSYLKYFQCFKCGGHGHRSAQCKYEGPPAKGAKTTSAVQQKDQPSLQEGAAATLGTNDGETRVSEGSRRAEVSSDLPAQEDLLASAEEEVDPKELSFQNPGSLCYIATNLTVLKFMQLRWNVFASLAEKDMSPETAMFKEVLTRFPANVSLTTALTSLWSAKWYKNTAQHNNSIEALSYLAERLTGEGDCMNRMFCRTVQLKRICCKCMTQVGELRVEHAFSALQTGIRATKEFKPDYDLLARTEVELDVTDLTDESRKQCPKGCTDPDFKEMRSTTEWPKFLLMDFDRSKAQGAAPKMFKVGLDDSFTLYDEHKRRDPKVAYELVATSQWTGSTINSGHYTTAVKLSKNRWVLVDSGSGECSQSVKSIDVAEVMNSERTVVAFYRRTFVNEEGAGTALPSQQTPERVCALPKKKLMGAGFVETFLNLFSLRKKQVTSMQKDANSKVGMSETGKGCLTADISGPPDSFRAADHSRNRPLGEESCTGVDDGGSGCGASESSFADCVSQNDTLFLELHQDSK